MTLLGGRLSAGRLFVSANDVKVDGILITGGTAPAQAGNIHVGQFSRIEIANVTVMDSAGACVSVNYSTTVLIRDSEFARCAQEGFHGQWSTDITLLRNRIHHNNPNGQYDPGHEAGGGKISNTSDLDFIENHSYSNGGPGLWCDINCRDVLFDRNRVHHNSIGIFFEISDGAEIVGNIAYNNGPGPWCYGAGILVSSSKNAYVHDNVAAWNDRGISFLSQDRGGTWNDTRGNRAANNTVIDENGHRLMNWCQDFAGNLFTSGNSGSGGRYWAGVAEPVWERFEWQTPRSTLADFNATPGDEGGRYLTTAERDAILTANGIPPGPAGAPLVATATMESQAWWNIDGIEIPEAVGHHTHARVTYPTGVVDGRVTFPVRITLHDQVGGTSWLRLQAVEPSGANPERWRQDFELGGCHDCYRDIEVTVDVSSWPTGRHELRFTANVPDEQPAATGAQRMFESTGIQLCVRSCTPTYRSGNWLEARGWYDNSPAGEAHGYQNARLTSDLSTVRSGGTIAVRLGPGSDGLATTEAGVYIDPDFHAGSAGTVVRHWTGPYTGNVTLPTLPSGTHRLVLVSSDGQNAGVLAIPFVVP